MDIRILRIKVNWIEFKYWLNNEGFINLTSEDYLSSNTVARFYDEESHKHYQRRSNDPYYSFDEWCKKYKIFTKSDLDLCYGSDNWHYEIIEDDNFDPQWLIIVLIEKQ